LVHGSFTGIRIGISTAKAFIDSLQIKAVGVNALEALAFNVKSSGIICSLIDARKENVYCTIFSMENEQYSILVEPSFQNINNVIDKLKNLTPDSNITFVGDGAICNKDRIFKAFPYCTISTSNELSAKNIALVGLKNYINNSFTPIEPLYLKKTEAEQKMEEKNANK